MDEAEKNHDEHLNKLMRRIQKANVHLNAEKLKYKSQEVNLLVTFYQPKATQLTQKRYVPSRKWNTLRTSASCDGFVACMVNYLAKYVQGLATLMEPLHQLTRKDSLWEWMPEHSMAFDRIKTLLVSAPTLIFFLTTRSRQPCNVTRPSMGLEQQYFRRESQSLIQAEP